MNSYVETNKELPQKEKNKHIYFVNTNMLCGYVKYYFLLMFCIDSIDEALQQNG